MADETDLQTRNSKSKQSGLVMPVSRIERNLRKGRYAKRIGTAGAVFMTAALEYLTIELLELAGDAAIQNKKKRIIPRHLMLAIENDSEFKKLMKNVTISEAGVTPHIHPNLLPKNSKKNQPLNPVSQEI